MWIAAGTASAQPTQHTENVKIGETEQVRQTVWKVALGATGNSGNTEAVSANAGASLEYRHDQHALSMEVLGTLGYASQTTVDASGLERSSFERNAANVLGRVRYDYYLTPSDALFAAAVPRRDKFAGIDLRIQWQAGYLRNLYAPEGNHRLWAEAGVDITQDYYAPVFDNATMATVATPDDVFYSARTFVGYTYRVYEEAGFSAGLEFLYDVNEPSNYRFNGHAELTSTLNGNFKLGAGFRVLYDHLPVVGARRADTISTLQLVYTFDSRTPPPAAPACPPCEGGAGEAAKSKPPGEPQGGTGEGDTEAQPAEEEGPVGSDAEGEESAAAGAAEEPSQEPSQEAKEESSEVAAGAGDVGEGQDAGSTGEAELR